MWGMMLFLTIAPDGSGSIAMRIDHPSSPLAKAIPSHVFFIGRSQLAIKEAQGAVWLELSNARGFFATFNSDQKAPQLAAAKAGSR